MWDVMTDRQHLIQLLRDRSVKRGHFTLASGKTSDLYIDARVTTMSPEGLALIGPLAIPLIRAFTVRKEAKIHGTGKLIEGPFQKGDHVAIVEDVITTGASTLRAIDAVTRAGGHIEGVLALLDRGEEGRTAIENAGYRVMPIIHLTEVVS